MAIGYFIRNNNLFDSAGREVVANDQGIVEVTVAGLPKRFVKVKFITWLINNPASQCKPPVQRIIQVRPQPVKKERLPRDQWKTRKKQKVRKKENKPRNRTGFIIYAIQQGRKIGPFNSLKACSETIGLSKSSISKTLKGRRNYDGWKFEKVA